MTSETDRSVPNISDYQPRFVLTVRDAGPGRVQVNGFVIGSENEIEGLAALIDKEDGIARGTSPTVAQDRRLAQGVTIGMLATELDVHRRSIERCLNDRTLVPTSWVGARVRFSREQVDALK